VVAETSKESGVVLSQLAEAMPAEVRFVFSQLVMRLVEEQAAFAAHVPRALYMHVRVFLIGLRGLLVKRLTNNVNYFALQSRDATKPSGPTAMCVRERKLADLVHLQGSSHLPDGALSQGATAGTVSTSSSS
jgi:hypothetical protein